MSDLSSILEKLSAVKSENVFRPVKTNEAAMKSREAVDGLLYFSVDSHKIYLGNDNKYVPMGGNSGVFYANRVMSEEDFPEPIFGIEDIESDQLPLVDDLIINTSSSVAYNGFYRVVEVISEFEVRTIRLEVGGGGGGTGGGGSSSGFVKIEYISPSTAADSTLASEEYVIKYRVVATDSAGDDVHNSGTALWKVNGTVVATKSIFPGENEFRVDQYFDTSRSVNDINLSVSIDTGGETLSVARKSWSIKAVDLKLDWQPKYGQNNNGFNSEDTFALSWTPYGGIDCVTHILVDGQELDPVPIKSYDTGKPVTKSFPSFPYGTYIIDMYLTAEVGGTQYQTETITGEIMFNKPGTGSNILLAVPYFNKTATQYNTLEIPFVVFDPNAETAKVSFYVDGVLEFSKEYNRDLQYWNYTVEKAGSVTLSLVCEGIAARNIELLVSEIDLNVSEPEGAKFKLSAKTLPDSKESLENWEQNGVTLQFSDNFDWDNGGVKSEVDENGDIRKFICIKNNTFMTIKYDLFGNSGKQFGKNFKFVFKATNCYDYDAQVMSCYEEASGVGLRVNAQYADFTGSDVPLNTQFYEDSYIELEADIWPETSGTDNYIMLWVDGIPAGVAPYNAGTSVFQQSNPKEITIGSPECDVYVYLVKLYEKFVNENEHLSNFILDAPTTKEMLRRYHANDILDVAGRISYEKLVENNPDCPAHLYEIPKMTVSKKNKIEHCSYKQYWSNPKKPDLMIADLMMKVQGTSSAAYGVAAYNVDTAWGDNDSKVERAPMTDGDGNILRHYDDNGVELEQYRGMWAMSDHAIPIDYACTKVNVASCEGANNAVNAQWYNDHQPYYDGHRRKNPKARDCMEFIPGVMFIKDKNNNKDYGNLEQYLNCNVFCDDPDYMKLTADSRPYLQYAICNMGNSKDNIHVFHDVDNPKACCVEVTDNQNAEHWMTKPIEPNEDGTFTIKDNFYEFRYPDGNDEATEEMNTGWARFVNWMASCDPSPYDEISHPCGYTGELLEKPVTYGKYTFKGFIPPGFDKSTNGPVTLEGFTTEEYVGTYYYDDYKYRMAKMLNECEDYLVMDSVVYHYLFIQRHTMIDNVAKNTFWSSEDLLHWDLTKNYDNDTSDGNNNTGFLTLKYGVEAMDKMLNDDADSVNVFNAPGSVWFNFVFGLNEVQKNLYEKLNNTNTWDAKAYLNEFKKYQDVIPERCWIYDFFRKYIRPNRLGFDPEGSYIKRLQGGKKTHQRTNFETYQEFYMASKYQVPPSFSESLSIDFRANAGPLWGPDVVTPLTTYIDCYAIVQVGGQIWSQRLKKGETCNIPLGQLVANVQDATSYYHSSAMIQTLSGIESLYTTYVKMPNADKMRSIVVGSDAPGYKNGYLSSVGFQNSTMLERIEIQNSGTKDILGLDLKKLKSLKVFKSNGSTFPSIMFADDGLLEEAYINNVGTLEMSNLQHLKTFVIDENPVYPKYNLTVLKINNCPTVDSYDIVKNSKLLHYQLQDVDWVITDNVLNGKKLETLEVIDKLKDIENNSYGPSVTSLTGRVLIDMDCEVDEYTIYQKYCKAYPNLEIVYSEKVNLNPASPKLVFYGDEGKTVPIYSVHGPADGSISVETLISANGPTGIAIKDPTKADSNTHTFTFANHWIDVESNKTYYNEKAAANPIEGAESLSSLFPRKDMEFIPVFTPIERFYNVRFFIDGKPVMQARPDGKEVDTWLCKYDTVYDGPIKNFAYKEHPDMNKRYKFLGWSLESAGRNPKFENLDTFKIKANVNFYAYFKEEDVIMNPTSLEYFDIRGGSLALRPEYRDVLRGKVTIPLRDDNGNYITAISQEGFLNVSKITHIYFQNNGAGGQITRIYNDAFRRDDNAGDMVLKFVHLPETLTHLGDRAFFGRVELQEVIMPMGLQEIGQEAFSCSTNIDGNMQVNIGKELPSALKTIGNAAFFKGGPNIKFTTIPTGVRTIGQNTFAFCENLVMKTFGGPTGGVTSIGPMAFWYSGTNAVASGDVVFEQSVSTFPREMVNGFPTGPLDTTQNPFDGSYLWNNNNISIIIKNQDLQRLLSELPNPNDYFGGTSVSFS